MKKKIKSIILLFVLVSASFVYAHIDKTHVIYDANAETSAYLSTGSVSAGTVEQQFTVQEEVLDGVSIKCGIIGDVSSENVELQYRILDENKNEVRDGSLNAAEIKANRFHKIKFEQIENCEGETYTLVLSGKNMSPEKGVSFYYLPSQEQSKTFTISDNETDGSLILKTISHQFDLETFVVVIIFILYIVIFMKVLYKIFN